MIQAGIHPGEIDGKDAGMMLLRDIAFYGKDALLDRVNLILIPILSVDGHERASAYSRPNQRGPRIQGWRNTATNQNLNRDYLKLDQPEMQAVRGLILKYRPDLYVDVHVTDGLDYQYDVTYGFNGEDGTFSRSPNGSAWLDTVFKPAMNAALEREGHIPGELVFGIDDDEPKKGLSDGGLGERFSNGWGAAAHVPTILIENHSLKPHEQRVLGTYVFIEEALRLLADQGADLKRGDRSGQRPAPGRDPRQLQGRGDAFLDPLFKGMLYETYDSPASGRKEIRWLGRPDPELWQMPFYGSKPDLTLSGRRPIGCRLSHRHHRAAEDAWDHDGNGRDASRRRCVHAAPGRSQAGHARQRGPRPGLGRDGRGRTPRLDLPHRLGARADGSAAGRHRRPAAGAAVQRELLRLGHVPRGDEPGRIYRGLRHRAAGRKDDGRRPGAEGRVRGQGGRRAQFAADPQARLAWFYERTPFYDDHYLLYPVGRED
jgi:hypothetical protein